MTVKAEDVPDGVLSTLLEEAPAYLPGSGLGEPSATRDGWRYALALALTAWEAGRPATYQAHEHRWTSTGVKVQRVLGIATVTQVAQACNGCGTLQSVQLNGEWTLAEVTAGRPAGLSPRRPG